MARSYLREVRHIQPRGPYYLGGYCLGGTIAYEMAQILKSEGEDVPLVAMLDTYNFSRALRVSFRSFLLQKMRFHAANLLSMGPRDIYAYLREKLRLLRGGELAHLRNSMPGGGPQEGTSRATCGIEASIQALNDNAAETYVPRPYPGELTLFKPRLNYKFYPDPNMGWGDLAVDGLDIIEVTENPHSMLLEPYVKTLAGQLKGRIDAASSARSVLRTLEREVAPVDLRPVV
jgi:thioesterase domain-containing protein